MTLRTQAALAGLFTTVFIVFSASTIAQNAERSSGRFKDCPGPGCPQNDTTGSGSGSASGSDKKSDAKKSDAKKQAKRSRDAAKAREDAAKSSREMTR